MNISRIKSIFILILFCIVFYPLVSFAQDNAKFTIKDNSITIKEALAIVEKQTGFSIAYNESKLNGNKVISLALENAPLEEVMKEILKNTGFSYKIQGQYMIISETANSVPRVVSGRVLDERKQPMIGVAVIIKGQGTGTTTNVDGYFKIGVKSGNILEVSFLGYAKKEIRVTDTDVYNVSMEPDTKLVDEVVVTALGIKRAEKALAYNVQKVNNEELTTVKSPNFLNSLAGKAAGVVVSSSASGPGGGVKVIMRGAKSISQNNNALYVIDGIPMYNKVASGGTSAMSVQPGTESISDINPDDIESMTLLTGPSAAALYGYEGANGVVLITTKKGRADKTSVSFSNSTIFSTPLMMPKFQNVYGNVPGVVASWGGGN